MGKIMKSGFALGWMLVSGLVAGLVAPSDAAAGNVGYWMNDYQCVGLLGDPSSAIIAAGHTPVKIAYPQGEQLDGLDALVIGTCGWWGGNTDINNAVASGMGLVLDVGQGWATPSVNLPGAPSFVVDSNCPTNIDIADGSPIASGPGGNLDNASFDFNSGLCALVGAVSIDQLPTGSHAFLVDGNAPGSVGAFGYPHGQGRVAYSMSQISRLLPGTGSEDSMPWAPAVPIYFANAIAWVTPTSSATTCASEGYKGTQLTWCKNICENGLTGKSLDTWIKRWIDRYRDLPYCAVGK